MTESQWNYTRSLWDSYIKQTVVPEAIKVMQLQAACDQALRQRVFDTTGTRASLTTEKAFLDKIKELAVIVVHRSIHLRNLWKTVQQSDERVRAFMARVMSTADMCNMVIDCPNQTCGQRVSYRDHVVMQVIIHGLRDNDIRVRVLSRNTSGELTTLDKLVNQPLLVLVKLGVVVMVLRPGVVFFIVHSMLWRSPLLPLRFHGEFCLYICSVNLPDSTF